MKSTIFASVSLAALLALAPVASAQTTSTPPTKAATKTAPVKAAPAQTDNKGWIGLNIETKKGAAVGSVVDVIPATGKVKEIHVKIGADTVKFTAKQVTKKGDKLVTSLSAAQLKKLPKVKA